MGTNGKPSAGADEQRGYQFGAFKGVFTPSILTILGVIMYLRMGWVLGNAGLPLTLLIVTMASSITFLTGLSISATATNMQVGGGGAYYIISRSLGVEIGAAIGLPLFMAQSLSVAFYVIGFAEAVANAVDLSPLVAALPFALNEIQAVALITLVVLTIITCISADLALKAQMLILAAIVLSLASFFLGSIAPDLVFSPDAIIPPKVPFWGVFAVFFPAVTGILSGVSMSGDLKEPAKALPRGTLAAVLCGYLVYMSIPIVLSRIVPDERWLLTQPMVMLQIARWGSLILLGVWAATLSSALGTLLGAPRTMQALSRDRVLPRILGRGYGKTNDPRVATVATFLVALAAILLGDLNMIAPVLTMFFLTTYGLINLSAGLEGLIDSPSWRPQFRVSPVISLVGAAACFATMFMINPGATFIAGAVTAAVYLVVKRRNLNAQWGDMRYGVLMLMARFAIRHLARRDPSERTWRPNILVLSGSPQTRWYLIELAHAMVGCASCMTVAAIVSAREWTSEKMRSLHKSISDYLLKRDVAALVKIIPEDDMLDGAEALIKAYGFGPIIPNTILMGETEQAESVERFAGLIRLVHRMGRNLVMVREVENPPELRAGSTIDIWWRGQQSNIGLVLSLAYLLKRSKGWSATRIKLKRIIGDEKERQEIEQSLVKYIKEQRLDVDLDLVVREQRDVFEIIHESSRSAALVFIGLREPGPEETSADYGAYYQHLIAATEGLPVALVLASQKVDYQQIIGLR
jgi:amino acid transporter